MRRLVRPLLFALAAFLPLAAGPALRADAGFETDLGPQPPPPPPPERPTAPDQDNSVPAYSSPGDGAYWIAGHWEWQDGNWVWWPGYWDYPPEPNVVWIYGGTVFIDGHYVYQRSHWGRRGSSGSNVTPRDGSPTHRPTVITNPGNLNPTPGRATLPTGPTGPAGRVNFGPTSGGTGGGPQSGQPHQ